jgi:ribonuclease HI
MPQTNQRAELAAILRALQLAPPDQNVMIITDSTYSINCLTKWKDGWIRNGWKNSKGVSVLNQDLIKGVLAKIEERKKRGVRTSFEWVKGHAQSPGNIEADKLAVQGARGW